SWATAPAAGRCAAEVGRRRGAGGRSKVRGGVSGLCALPFSGRTLSVESQPRVWPLAGPAVFFLRWFYLRQGAGGGPLSRRARGSPRRARAQQSARRALRPVRAPIFRPDFIPWRRRRLAQIEQPPARPDARLR